MILLVTCTVQRQAGDDGLRFALVDEPPRLDGDGMRGVAVEWLGPLPAAMRLEEAASWWRQARESGALPRDLRHVPARPVERGRALGWWKHKLFPETYDEQNQRR